MMLCHLYTSFRRLTSFCPQFPRTLPPARSLSFFTPSQPMIYTSPPYSYRDTISMFPLLAPIYAPIYRPPLRPHSRPLYVPTPRPLYAPTHSRTLSASARPASSSISLQSKRKHAPYYSTHPPEPGRWPDRWQIEFRLCSG